MQVHVKATAEHSLLRRETGLPNYPAVMATLGFDVVDAFRGSCQSRRGTETAALHMAESRNHPSLGQGDACLRRHRMINGRGSCVQSQVWERCGGLDEAQEACYRRCSRVV